MYHIYVSIHQLMETLKLYQWKDAWIENCKMVHDYAFYLKYLVPISIDT